MKCEMFFFFKGWFLVLSMQITNFIATKDCSNSPDNNFQGVLRCKFSDFLTIIVCKTESLIFDERGSFCCKYKCKNYMTRCYCPPYSLELAKNVKSKKFAIIFAKTYDFSELKHFQSKKDDLNPNYLKKMRVFVRRWVQHNFYSGIKEIFSKWGLNQNDLFAGGFSFSKCKKCYNESVFNSKIDQKRKNCLKMPSPEALCIDVSKTLFNFNYYLEFGVKTHITKVSMIFTDNPSCDPYLNTKISKQDNLISKIPQIKDFNILLKEAFPNLCTSELEREFYIHALKKEFQWLSLWKRAIFWKSVDKNLKKIQAKIHEIVFMQNNYYALDFLVKDVFIPNFDKIDFIGVEFL